MNERNCFLIFFSSICDSLFSLTVEHLEGARPNIFNWYATVDRPPEQRPQRHGSRRSYKYRQRYSIKTRTHLKKHVAPECLKQYKFKPWKKSHESPLDSACNTNTRTRPLPKVRDVTNMKKKDLVRAMAWDHPTRTLDLGTVNSNCTRALKRKFGQQELSTLLPRIKESLARMVRQASQTKRTCQSAIGQYIEHLALYCIDDEEDEEVTIPEGEGQVEEKGQTIAGKEQVEQEKGQEEQGKEGGSSRKRLKKVLHPDDRNLLDLLCSGFSSKDLIDTNEDEMEESDMQEDMQDVDDSDDKKNLQLQFITILINAIYSRKYPNIKGKEVVRNSTAALSMPENVCSFIERAKTFLPAITKEGAVVDYPASSLLRSTAVQVSSELKMHYKNGSVDLCKKVTK